MCESIQVFWRRFLIGLCGKEMGDALIARVMESSGGDLSKHIYIFRCI